jgi:SAM-dependent methyltransferase
MDAAPCLICKSERERIFSFPVSDLVTQYRRQLSMDVGREFTAASEMSLVRCRRCDFASFIPPVTGSMNFYDRLQENGWYYLEEKPEFATARRFFAPGDRVLDVGCGSGAFAKDHPPANYLGLEFTAGSIAQARARGLTVRQQGVEEYAATAPERHDVVGAFQVLEHVADQGGFISACVAVCRPGGRIIFSTPNADAFVNAAKNVVLNYPPHHTAWFSRRFWLGLPAYFPLRLVEIIEEPLEPVHLKFYASTLVQASLERWLGLATAAPVDASLRNRILAKLSRGFGAFLARGLADERLRPRGQSITAVYERL